MQDTDELYTESTVKNPPLATLPYWVTLLGASGTYCAE